MPADSPAVDQDPGLHRHASAGPRESLSEKDEKSIHNAKSEPNVTDLEASPNAKDSVEQGSWYRPYILIGLAILILGWWISATVLKATRHRWYVVAVRMCTSCNQDSSPLFPQDCSDGFCLGVFLSF